MSWKKYGFVAILAGTAGTAVAVELAVTHRARTRPGCLTGIPYAPYPNPARSPSNTAISRTAVLLPVNTNEVLLAIERRAPSTELMPRLPPVQPVRPIIHLYQLDRQEVAIDHCAISQVALQLHSDGRWVLSLRADQNRLPGEGEPVVFNPRLHIKRNEFIVRLRCLGAFQNEPSVTEVGAGKPVVAALDPCTFWVENGQPRWLRTSGQSEAVRDYFDSVDRVEVEFFYH